MSLTSTLYIDHVYQVLSRFEIKHLYNGYIEVWKRCI